MKYEIFSIPIFIDTVDLSKIKIDEPGYEPCWLSDTPSSFGKEHNIGEETIEHLIDIFNRNLGNLVGSNPRFGQVWRNRYDKNDWQDIHIHPHCSWSFIIYESVEESKTVFMNPSYKDIQNQLGMNLKEFPLDFRPQLSKGDIIIFPSFLEHYVRPGSIGTTISGNLYMDYQ